MNINREAAKDALEYTRAQLAYGEGAGTRRKLIDAAVQYKISTAPGYEEAFYYALTDQDVAKYADEARKERRRKDLSKKIDRNVRSVISGNSRNLTTGAAVAAGLWYVAVETGYDKKVKARVRKEYNKAKSWVKAKRNGMDWQNPKPKN